MIKIRNYKSSDVFDVAKLVRDTYKKYNSLGSSNESTEWYIDKFDTEKNIENIKKMFANGTVTLVAEEDGKIVGFLWGMQNKIINLYVKGSRHRKGIGKKLVERYEKRVVALGEREVKIRSSLFAVSFYEKMGYKKTTGTRNFRRSGITIQPMKKILK